MRPRRKTDRSPPRRGLQNLRRGPHKKLRPAPNKDPCRAFSRTLPRSRQLSCLPMDDAGRPSCRASCAHLRRRCSGRRRPSRHCNRRQRCRRSARQRHRLLLRTHQLAAACRPRQFRCNCPSSQPVHRRQERPEYCPSALKRRRRPIRSSRPDPELLTARPPLPWYRRHGLYLKPPVQHR